MNKVILSLIVFLVTLNLLGVATADITTFLVVCLLLAGAVSWVWYRQFPRIMIKSILLIVFGPILIISLGSFLIQSISVLNPADALLMVIIIAGLFWLIPKLLK